MHSTLSMADARDLEHGELLERAEAILAQFDKPEIETQGQRVERISRTLDEVPQVYRWFLQLQSWLDHWTDSMNKMFGIKDDHYKRLRQRRDFFQGMASAAKMRYEAASREITIMQGFDPSGMPRQRRSDD